MSQCLRLMCFITLVLMAFLDIYISFNAEWKVSLRKGNNMDTNQNYETLWRKCNMPPTSMFTQCDKFFDRIGGGTAAPDQVAWRAMMAISIILVMAACVMSLLSLECVLMTPNKRWMAIWGGATSLLAAFFIGVVAIWFTIDKQMIGNNLSHVGDGAAFQNMDIFVPSPGPGLIFAYLVACILLAVGLCMIFNSSDEESYFEEDAEYGNPRATLLSAVSGIAGIPGLAAPGAYQRALTGNRARESRAMSLATGMRRPSMPMSMISGYPRPTVIRKPSGGETIQHNDFRGSRHSIPDYI